MPNTPRIPARFSIGDVVEIESKIHRRFNGKRGVIIDREISRHTHALDKYTVRFDGLEEIETFWDIELNEWRRQGYTADPPSHLQILFWILVSALVAAAVIWLLDH